MSDHIPDATKMVCPFCGLPEEVRGSGGGIWFECGSKHDERRTAFCKEREPLWRELTILRTANAALVERIDKYQREFRIAILRAERAEDRVKRLEGVLTAGVALMRATDPFTLTPDCENDDGVSLRQMHADSCVHWDEPPTACEHIALHDAVLAFGRAVAEAKANP